MEMVNKTYGIIFLITTNVDLVNIDKCWYQYWYEHWYQITNQLGMT